MDVKELVLDERLCVLTLRGCSKGLMENPTHLLIWWDYYPSKKSNLPKNKYFQPKIWASYTLAQSKNIIVDNNDEICMH